MLEACVFFHLLRDAENSLASCVPTGHGLSAIRYDPFGRRVACGDVNGMLAIVSLSESFSLTRVDDAWRLQTASRGWLSSFSEPSC